MPQIIRRERAGELAMAGQRNFSPLLGDHDRQRIGLLSQTNGRAMAGAEIERLLAR